jgi:hypothetical protein
LASWSKVKTEISEDETEMIVLAFGLSFNVIGAGIIHEQESDKARPKQWYKILNTQSKTSFDKVYEVN